MSTNDLTLVLECIDGKDDHLKVEITNGRSIAINNCGGKNSHEIQELKQHSGEIIFTNNNGLMHFDATACNASIKLNGNMASIGNMMPNDLLRIGNSIWRSTKAQDSPVASLTPGGQKNFTQHFGSFIGLEGLKDFKLKHIFSDVFKKHSLEEMEEQLVTGTSKNIPSITDIEVGWAKPWLFARLLLVSAVLIALMIIGFRMFQNPKIVPGLMFVGAFAMPLATLIFFLEMNAPRNISIFLIMFLVFVGGFASLFMTLVLGNPLEFLYKTFGAAGAPFIEEPMKLLLAVLIVGSFVRYKWILNGLLFGAALGVGFGGFESAGYAFDAIINPYLAGQNVFNFDGVVDSIVLRGMLAPFMHVVWTANAAGALWLVKGDKKFSWAMLGDMRFLRVFISSVALHFIWNSNFTLISIPVIYDVKFLILGFISWTICFMLVQAGLKQLNEARKVEIERLSIT
jgi:RsiW-degrading membrane proteinase PrsW (M82 family)